jgi:hypothetical protein
MGEVSHFERYVLENLVGDSGVSRASKSDGGRTVRACDCGIAVIPREPADFEMNFGHYTDPQCNSFLELFAFVVNHLPQGAREKLESYWSANTVILPYTIAGWPKGPQRSPVVIVWENFTEFTSEIKVTGGYTSYAVNGGEGRFMIFDSSLYNAPPVVAATLIAHEIGHSYQWAKYGKISDKSRTAEREVGNWLRKWGYDETDIELWAAVLHVAPDKPVPNFYAHRFAKSGRKPPANTPKDVMDEIRKILIEKQSPRANDL